jgi:hypothetical protein
MCPPSISRRLPPASAPSGNAAPPAASEKRARQGRREPQCPTYWGGRGRSIATLCSRRRRSTVLREGALVVRPALRVRSVCHVDNGSEGRDRGDGDRPRRRQARNRRLQADLRGWSVRPRLRRRRALAARPVQVGQSIRGRDCGANVFVTPERHGASSNVPTPMTKSTLSPSVATMCSAVTCCRWTTSTDALRLIFGLLRGNNQRIGVNWASDFELEATLERLLGP